MAGFNQINNDRIGSVKVAAILACQQNNVSIDGQAQTVRAQKVVNREFAKFLASSAAFRKAEGRKLLADASLESRARVLGTNKLLIVPKKVNCRATVERGITVYQDGTTSRP